MLITHSLRAGGFDASEDGTGRGTPIVTAIVANGDAHSGYRDEHGLVPICWDEELNVTEDQSGTVVRGGDGGRHAGVMSFKPGQGSGAGSIAYRDIAPTLSAAEGSNRIPGLHSGMAVRRLTPLECERLQGLPDHYTLVPYNGKPAKDGPRYKAIGNGMALPVVRWIGERILMSERVEA